MWRRLISIRKNGKKDESILWEGHINFMNAKNWYTTGKSYVSWLRTCFIAYMHINKWINGTPILKKLSVADYFIEESTLTFKEGAASCVFSLNLSTKILRSRLSNKVKTRCHIVFNGGSSQIIDLEIKKTGTASISVQLSKSPL